jgi:hypothetical protein
VFAIILWTVASSRVPKVSISKLSEFSSSANYNNDFSNILDKLLTLCFPKTIESISLLILYIILFTVNESTLSNILGYPVICLANSFTNISSCISDIVLPGNSLANVEKFGSSSVF